MFGISQSLKVQQTKFQLNTMWYARVKSWISSQWINESNLGYFGVPFSLIIYWSFNQYVWSIFVSTP